MFVTEDPTWATGPQKTTIADDEAGEIPDVKLGSDFEPRSVLGQGSGGTVYLARQHSLNRLVALKVVPDAGVEANTLAQLEHENIVRVFSETVDRELHRRVICMQYVVGTTLSRVIRHLALNHRQATGSAILQAIDELTNVEVPLDPAFRAERARLEQADAIGAVCLIGAAVARALGHAHARGVVHRDVKPGNILLTPYGRPMLVDFDTAGWAHMPAAARAEARFGATPRYASPEQLLALVKEQRAAIDARADLYSLGLVLFELLSGDLPFMGAATEETVQGHLAVRSSALKPLGREERSAAVLERCLHRCLTIDPNRRYSGAGDVAAALDACAQLRACETELPPAGPGTRLAQRAPMTALFLAAVVPNLAGTLVNAIYLTTLLRRALDDAQLSAYYAGALFYCMVTFPLATAAVAIVVRQAAFRIERLTQEGARPADAIQARQLVLAIPTWAAMTAFISWVIAVPFLPWFISRAASPIPLSSALHAASFVLLCGVIGFCYSSIFTLHVGLRVIVPWVTLDGRDLAVGLNVSSLPRRLRVLQLLSAMCLPTSAVIGLAFWPDPMGASVRAMLGALLWGGAIGATGAMYAAGEAILSAKALDRLRTGLTK